MTWILLALTGCDRTYDGPPPTGDEAAVYGRVVGLLGSGIGSVDICQDDAGCVESASDGDFLLEPIPVEEDVIVTMEKSGHLSTAFLHNTSLDVEWRKTLMSDAIVNLMTNRVDTQRVPGKGHAMFILWGGPHYDDYDRVEGVAFDVLGTGEGERFYQAGGGLPDEDLIETSSSGSGGVFNLEPGMYELSFDTGDGRVCEPWFSYAFEPGEPVPVEVLPDMASYIDLICR